MNRCDGIKRVNDDEWYTPLETAARLAEWLATDGGLALDTSILCPADILPNGTESAIPQALRWRGFTAVRVTRDLPMDEMFADYQQGEVIVTNPPFTLLTPFRRWLLRTGARYCVLSRPAAIPGYSVPCMGQRFYSTDGRRVAACWMQNLRDTQTEPPEGVELGNCADCESKACPVNAHTGDWTPGRPRKLYGYGTAANNGIAGNWCSHHTRDGKETFIRFFVKPSTGADGPRKEAT
jgi:hypothetical protein